MNRTTVDAHTGRRLGLTAHFDRRTLERAQMDRLQRTLRHCTSSPFYRKRFEHRVPYVLDAISDIRHLPMLDSKELVRYGQEMLCISQAQVARVVTMATSGSTGVPKRFWFSQADLAATSEFFADGMRTLVTPESRVLVLLPWQLPASVGDLLIASLTRDHIHAVGIWPPPDTTPLAQLIRREGITCLVGLPPQLLALAEALPVTSLDTVLLCSDYAAPALRKRIEARGCRTFLHYGSTESGLGGGVECSCHDGCHLRESDLLVEIVDPVSGIPVTDGEVGELVITTLGRQAMPLIRYRTGDLASLERSRCSCGGITARLKNIRGRKDACLPTGGGVICSSELDDALYPVAGLLDYRAMLADGTAEKLDIRYCGPAGLEAAIRRALAAVPPLSAGLALGDVTRVENFGADHRYKRMIIDNRKE